MDEITLDWVLDEFGPQLQTFNRDNGSKPDAKLGRLGHPLRFLPSLVEPRQFECVARRAGTLLEEELIRFACRRTGRTSRYRDSEGAQCERLLAMIDGTGFEALVVAELDRSDPFGREDGYSAALWVESDAVTKALQAVSEVHDSDGYRQVIRMQALAVHQCDTELEAMVRANTPIYVNAAEMRGAEGRPMGTLLGRIEHLIARSDQEDLRIAAQLAGFLRDTEEVHVLVPAYLKPDTDESVSIRF